MSPLSWDFVYHIISLAVMLGGFYRALRKGLDRIKEMETKMDIMFTWWQNHIKE